MRPVSSGPGFTLAELAVVLVLAGLILSVVVPRFGGVGQEERLRTSVRRLAGLALEAHTQAVTEARPWFLCLDLDQGRLWLAPVRPGRAAESEAETRAFGLPRGIVFKDAVHPDAGRVMSGRVSFGFWPQGGSEPGAVHLKDAEGREMTLFLRPYLGRTEIKEGYVREERE